MTPTQLDHLRLLKTHLESLLETAKKRTPGKWTVDKNLHDGGIRAPSDHVFLTREAYLDAPDADFIASCAGNAEAGWQSTLTAVSGLSEMARMIDSSVPEYEGCGRDAVAHLEKILAAWPIENLR